MKPILTRLEEQLRAKGLSPSEARATAVETLQKSGSLKPGTTEMTQKGIERTEMGAKGRAIDRASKASGHAPSDYVYSSKLNRARLKK